MTESSDVAVFSAGEVRLDRRHGIVRVSFVPGTVQDLDNAREEFAAVVRVSRGERLPLLVDMANTKSITREARAFFASDEVAKALSAVALLSRSSVTTMMANVYFAVFGDQGVPTKLFTQEAEAIAWLKGFRA